MPGVCVSSYLILACLIVIVQHTKASRILEVYVDEENGRDTSNCTIGNNIRMPCLTLEYAAENTGNGTAFILLSATITVKTLIEFKYRSGVSIVGNLTTVKCNCSINHGGCGLVFNDSTNIILRYLQIKNCTFIMKKFNLLTAVSFIGSSNIAMTQIEAFNSRGSAISVINCYGNFSLDESNFSNNSQHSLDYFGGGGVIIVANADLYSQAEEETTIGNYLISHCQFHNNIRTIPKHNHQQYHHGYGGGLNIIMNGSKVRKNTFFMTGCKFENNTSLGGGGMAVNIQDGSSDNAIQIQNCSFTRNNGSYDQRGGGGGLKITVNSKRNFEWMTSESYAFNGNNTFTVTGCEFKNNRARYGGGSAVMVGKANGSPTNSVSFKNCQWTRNKASLSAALDISPDAYSQDGHCFDILVRMENCNVYSNSLVPITPNRKSIKQGYGIVIVTKITLILCGKIVFKDNQGSGLFISQSYIKVLSSSVIQFIGNRAAKGGAITMIGFSGIHYQDNVTFNFTNNFATFLGGAIYSANSDQHQSFSSYTCLFRPSGSRAIDVHFNFTNNRAGTNFSHSIYLVSLHPCPGNLSGDNTRIGNITFSDRANDSGYDVTTDVNEFYVANYSANRPTYTLYVIPGRHEHIPLKTYDDNGVFITVITTFDVNIINHTKPASVDQKTRVINDNRIIIHGEPGGVGLLRLSPISSRGLYLEIEFRVQNCPPGYILKNYSCHCSAKSLLIEERYTGISGCFDYSALLSPGLWVGYILKENETESENSLYTSYCPFHNCKQLYRQNKSDVFEERFLLLTRHASQAEIDEQICSENRHGTLCSQCKNGTSVYYHSNTYHCKVEKHCELGYFVYIAAELLPLVALFCLLLVFDLNLTSGAAYSILFTIQQFSILETSSLQVLEHRVYVVLLEASNVIYGFMNMEIFNIDSLSFCLWSNAQALDIISIRCASIVFSFCLLFAFIILSSKCNCHCSFLSVFRSRPSSRISIAKGLSSFLVLCYTTLTRITFAILTFGVPHGLGNKNTAYVSFLDGESRYFRDDHLKYAVPAAVIFVIVIIPPPLFFLSDPILLKCEDKTCYYRQPWTRLRMKLKPILDAFQNCFKDDCRYFAGLFFLYRFMIQLFLFVSTEALEYYYLVEYFLVMVLALHSIKQPFCEFSDNVTASVCILNLALINLSSIIIQKLVKNSSPIESIQVLQWVQLLLIYSPIFFGIGWIVKQLFLKRKINHATSIEDSVNILFHRHEYISSSYGSVLTEANRNRSSIDLEAFEK